MSETIQRRVDVGWEALSPRQRLLRYVLGCLAVLVTTMLILDVALAATLGFGFVFAQASYLAVIVAFIGAVSGALTLRMTHGYHPLLQCLIVGGSGSLLALFAVAIWGAVSGGSLALVPWSLMLGFWPSTAFIFGMAVAMLLAPRSRLFTTTWIATVIAIALSGILLGVLSAIR